MKKNIQKSWNTISLDTLNLYHKVIIKSKKSQTSKNRIYKGTPIVDKLILFSIISLAALFRFWELKSRFIFSGETNNILYSIQNLLKGDQSPLVGQQASYLHHLFQTPWYLYSMVPLFLISKGEPLYFAFTHSLLGVVSVWLMYKIGKNIKNKKFGYITAFVYAVTLEVINLDRSVWALSLIPLSTILSVYLLILSIKNKRILFYCLLGISMGFGLSLHYQFIIPATFIYLWIFIKKRDKFIYSLLPFLISLTPLFIFDIRHNFFNLVGLQLTSKILIEGNSAYSSKHFLYFTYPIVIISVSYIIKSINSKILVILLIIYLIIQGQLFIKYNAQPNYAERSALTNKILDKYNNGLKVFFKKGDSYEYKFLLLSRAKQRSLDISKIVIYDPWNPPDKYDIAIENEEIKLH